MNIFLLSYERHPAKHFKEQAAFHCDKHVVKMIAETVQLIVTGMASPNLAQFYPFPSMSAAALPCKPLGKGHAQHPCARWAGASINHIHYLVRLGIALCREKAKRWPLNADHEYEPWLHAMRADLAAVGFQDHDPIPADFAVAVKDEALRAIAHPHHQAVAIYRNYYVTDKMAIATWKRSMVPLWFQMAMEDLVTDTPI